MCLNVIKTLLKTYESSLLAVQGIFTFCFRTEMEKCQKKMNEGPNWRLRMSESDTVTSRATQRAVSSPLWPGLY